MEPVHHSIEAARQLSAALIVSKARTSISSFCMNECNALCCRKGNLVMNAKELQKVTKGNQEIIATRVSINAQGKFSLGLKGDCPSLSGTKCTIHKSSLRPKVCGDFPISLNGNKVFVSNKCTAANAGKLYGHIRRLELLGFSVAMSDQFSHLDLGLINIKK